MKFIAAPNQKMVYDPKTSKPKLDGTLLGVEGPVSGEQKYRNNLPAEVVAAIRNFDHLTLLKMLPKEKQIELAGSELRGSPNTEQWLRIRDLSKVELYLNLPQEKREEILMSAVPPQVRVWNTKLD